MPRPLPFRLLFVLLALPFAAPSLSGAEPLPPIQMDGPADPEGVYVQRKRQRSPEEVAKLQAELPKIDHAPPADRFENLPKTRKILEGGEELSILMLGDSIVNDMARSDWTFGMDELYPDSAVEKTTVVRGSTGSWWYREPGRVERYVLAFQPDLVLIGGISHRDDADAIRDVMRQIRSSTDADILLMTGPFGSVDPTDDEQWKKIVEPAENSYARKLVALAKEENVGFLDLQRHWGEAVRGSGKPVTDFKRDVVHANALGEQILGQILIRHLGPEE
ncbi:MAG TPA: hypothetical protein VGN57_05375 [Pirellulaceae bacterium]|jgi:hypothetical protein|nr:hypothetical protein [Pirellulaceae bacterium]